VFNQINGLNFTLTENENENEIQLDLEFRSLNKSSKQKSKISKTLTILLEDPLTRIYIHRTNSKPVLYRIKSISDETLNKLFPNFFARKENGIISIAKF